MNFSKIPFCRVFVSPTKPRRLKFRHNYLEKANVKGEEKIGLKILKRTLEEPIRQIAQNAGVDGAVAAEEVKKKMLEENIAWRNLIKFGEK